jgi:hypothetical protein
MFFGSDSDKRSGLLSIHTKLNLYAANVSRSEAGVVSYVVVCVHCLCFQAFVSSLVMKLQLYVQQLNSALEDTSQQVILFKSCDLYHFVYS